MTQKLTRYCIFFLACFAAKLPAQSSSDYAVQLSATTVVSPASITLHWINDPLATSYSVDRKTKTATTWEPVLATLPGTANQYIDYTVVADSAYEYRVQKVAASYTGRGYIYAGIMAPPIHYRGKMLLMVDSLFDTALPTEIFQLMKDVRADGWAVEKFVVGRNDAVTAVKETIVNAYNADPAHVNAVLLLGHIPVPYSGNINPDGHDNHVGAWPADVYYGDINGIWTDNVINNASAGRPENRNLPGDGKFDNSFIPTNIELQVSRIDFNNMPLFAQGEIALMSSYLNKNHAYKWKMIEPSHRSLVDDNFGAFGGEAFASSGWRNFSPLVGDTSIFNVDFISSLNTSDYQWAYGCGGGSYQGAGGIGTTANFSGNSVKGIFTMLFGSYFGDWDSQNNFLRAPLCADDPALTSAWAGRPHWFFHHMAMGENIGYSAKWTQNNSGTYAANFGARYVHIALMGDLSLREDAMLPPSTLDLKVSENNNGATLSWVASTDSPIGYYVYRSKAEFGKYDLIAPLVTGNSFSDTNGTSGLWYYMVRAAKIQHSPSGTYINLSEGIVDSLQVNFTSDVQDFTLTNQLSVFPNPASQSVFVSVSNPDIHAALHIYDMYGKSMLSRTISSSLEEINVSKFPVGIYLLSVNTIKGSVIKRFEVLK